jgi:hypothetical protein
MRKEEGATVDFLSSAILFSLPFLSGQLRYFVGPFRQRSSLETFKPSAGKLH